MSTIQQDEPRIAAAVREVESAIQQAQQAAKNKELCFRLSTMDLERRDLLTGGDIFSIRQTIQNLKPRPLGTDLGIIRGIFQLVKSQSQEDRQCQVSHIVVVTDIPAEHAWSGLTREEQKLVFEFRDTGIRKKLKLDAEWESNSDHYLSFFFQ